VACQASGIFVDAFPRKFHKKHFLFTVGALSIFDVKLKKARGSKLKRFSFLTVSFT